MCRDTGIFMRKTFLLHGPQIVYPVLPSINLRSYLQVGVSEMNHITISAFDLISLSKFGLNDSNETTVVC